MGSMPAGGAQAQQGLPGTSAGQKRAAIRSRALALSPTGRSWAAATTEGILIHSLDPALVFDPTDLAEDVTPGGESICCQFLQFASFRVGRCNRLGLAEAASSRNACSILMRGGERKATRGERSGPRYSLAQICLG